MKTSWLLLVISFLFATLFLTAPRSEALPVPTSTGTVSGRLFATGGHNPLGGRRVELRRGPLNTFVAAQNTNTQGYFTFSGVATSTNTSFHIIAGNAPNQAHWYFVLNPGQSIFQNLSLPFWP
jgi:hypothetical protein